MTVFLRSGLPVISPEMPMYLEGTLADGEKNASFLYKAVELFQNPLADLAG